MRQTLVLLAMAIIVAVAFTGGAAEEPALKIGFVDLDRVLQDSRAGGEASKKFEGEFARAKEDLRRQREEVKRLQGELQKKAMLVKEAAWREMEDELIKKRRDLERTAEDVTREFQRKQSELQLRFASEFLEIVHEIGQQRGFTVILGPGAVLYRAKSADLTDEVIRIHDKRKKS